MERVEGHTLHFLQRPHGGPAVLGAHGRDTETAVTDHGCGNAMPGRDAEAAIPDDLGVVVGVDVDKAGADNAPRCINGLCGTIRRSAKRHDAAVDNANVAANAVGATAVDDSAIDDLQVVAHARCSCG